MMVRFRQYVCKRFSKSGQSHPSLKASRETQTEKRISCSKKITSSSLETNPTCSLQCSCFQFVCFCSLYLLFYHILMEKKRKKGQSLSLLYCSILYRSVGPEETRGNPLDFGQNRSKTCSAKETYNKAPPPPLFLEFPTALYYYMTCWIKQKAILSSYGLFFATRAK